MATDIQPYIAFKPGDPIRAEDSIEMQKDIRKDIQDSVKAAEDRIKLGTVAKADDATKFAEKTATDWVGDLGKIFAPIVHDHEGIAAYRRFIKEFSPPDRLQVFLRHKLGRYPLVDLYLLQPVLLAFPQPPPPGSQQCKVVVYHFDKDATEQNGLLVRAGRDREYLGIPFEQFLKELGVDYTDDHSMDEVVGDMWDALMKDPNDEIAHCVLPWVQDCCDKGRTVGETKKREEWVDIRVAFRPVKCGFGGPAVFIPPESATLCLLEILQVNYDTVRVTVTSDANQWKLLAPIVGPDQKLDLMFLLRS